MGDLSQPISLNSGTLVQTAKQNASLELPRPSLPQPGEGPFERVADSWRDETES